jgi:hypothetical protein
MSALKPKSFLSAQGWHGCSSRGLQTLQAGGSSGKQWPHLHPPPQCHHLDIDPPRRKHSCWSSRGPRAHRGRPWRRRGLTICVCVRPQILYRARDLEAEPRSHLVRGNHTRSALLGDLRKFVLYELQVLAFTRIGNGVPSSPLVLERTKDDGTCVAGPSPPRPPPGLLLFQSEQCGLGSLSMSVPTTEGSKTKLFRSHCAGTRPAAARSGVLWPGFEPMQKFSAVGPWAVQVQARGPG